MILHRLSLVAAVLSGHGYDHYIAVYDHSFVLKHGIKRVRLSLRLFIRLLIDVT